MNPEYLTRLAERVESLSVGGWAAERIAINERERDAIAAELRALAKQGNSLGSVDEEAAMRLDAYLSREHSVCVGKQAIVAAFTAAGLACTAAVKAAWSLPEGWKIARTEFGGIRVDSAEGSWLSMPPKTPQPGHSPLERRLLYGLAEAFLASSVAQQQGNTRWDADARARDLLASVVFHDGGAGADLLRDQNIPMLGVVKTQDALRAITIAMQPINSTEAGNMVPAFRERVSEIEDAVAAGKMNAYKCFTQMRQLIVKPFTQDAGPAADVLHIARSESLDPIYCYFEDFAPGVGRITVACFGDAWTGAWSGMGDRTVRQFVSESDSHYLASSLLQLRGANNRLRNYTARIATAVIAALNLPKTREGAP